MQSTNASALLDTSDNPIAALYRKGKMFQWDADRDLDWNVTIDPSAPVYAEAFPVMRLPIFKTLSTTQQDTITARFTQHLLSQFLHGEHHGMDIASRLVAMLPDRDAQLYAATQVLDETRHAEVFRRYLGRCGGVVEPDPELLKFVRMLVGLESWPKIIIGAQIVIEGAAIASFCVLRKLARDPLLKDMLEKMIRDESRHVGFGNLYLRRKIFEMPEAEREDIADFAFEAIVAFSMTRRGSLRAGAKQLAEVGISIDAVFKEAAISIENGAPLGDVVSDGISNFVIPALRRVGALTPRVEDKLKQARFSAPAASEHFDEVERMSGGGSF